MPELPHSPEHSDTPPLSGPLSPEAKNASPSESPFRQTVGEQGKTERREEDKRTAERTRSELAALAENVNTRHTEEPFAQKAARRMQNFDTSLNLFKEKRDELIGPPRPITVL